MIQAREGIVGVQGKELALRIPKRAEYVAWIQVVGLSAEKEEKGEDMKSLKKVMK